MIRTDGDRAEADCKRILSAVAQVHNGLKVQPRALRAPAQRKIDYAAYSEPCATGALLILFLPLPHGVCVSHSVLPSPFRSKCQCLISSDAPAMTRSGSDLKIPLKAVDAAAISTVHGEVVTAKETGTYVLKPFRSPKSKKLKAAVVFVPRLSHFDIENERSNRNEFRVL
jgi:hypothetical protein